MREAIDPVVAAELAAVDAALAGEREDPEIAAILAEARAAAAPMTPAFAERLDEAAARGFAPARPRTARTWRGPQLLTGLATAAAVLLVLVIVSAGGSGGDGSAGSSESVGPAQGTAGASSSSSGASSSSSSSGASPSADDKAAPSTASPAGVAPPGGPRKVQRAAQLILATPAPRLQDTADKAAAVAARLGGFVARSDVSAGGAQGQADFDLRVPAGRLNAALASLSRLGHVRSQSAQSQDVTAAYVSARSQLHDALAERAALLRALAAATTQPQIDSIHARLDLARRRIAEARGALRSVRRQTDMAAIGLTIVGVPSHHGAGGGHGGGGWTPGRGARDALSVLSAASGLTIVALAALLPAALLALLAAVAWRQVARRRREAALDAGAGGTVSV